MKLIKYWDSGWYVALLVKTTGRHCHIIPLNSGGLTIKKLPAEDETEFMYLTQPIEPAVVRFRQAGERFGMTQAVKGYLS